MIRKFLSAQTKSITLASIILGFFYLVSALLGLFRDRLLAGTFGAGDKLDVYYAAFQIPDFVAMTLILGAISAAIIPVFSAYWVKNKDEAWKFASDLVNVFFLILIIICAVLAIFAPFLVSLIAPGFSPEKREMTAQLTRIMFLSPILLGISSLVSGILQVFHRFFVTALAPAMYNLGIIFGILILVPRFGITGLAWGVVLGGCLHLGIQLPVIFASGFKWQKSFNYKDSGVRRVLKLMVPRSLGLAANQINTIVITIVASTLLSGSIAVFALANNLASIIISLTAIPVSTAIFPLLSMEFSKNNREEFLRRFYSVFSQLLFLILPLSALFFVLRAQIVRVILGTGRFTWNDTRLTAACLGFFALGLFAQGLIPLVSKTFYSTHNTKIPAIISGITVALTIGLSFFFVWVFSFANFFSSFMINFLNLHGLRNIKVIGLPLADALAGVFQIILLVYFLYKKIGDFGMAKIFKSLGKIVLATLLLILSSYYVLNFVSQFIITNTFVGILFEGFCGGVAGLLVYLGASHFMKIPELGIIKGVILRKNGSSAN